MMQYRRILLYFLFACFAGIAPFIVLAHVFLFLFAFVYNTKGIDGFFEWYGWAFPFLFLAHFSIAIAFSQHKKFLDPAQCVGLKPTLRWGLVAILLCYTCLSVVVWYLHSHIFAAHPVLDVEELVYRLCIYLQLPGAVAGWLYYFPCLRASFMK